MSQVNVKDFYLAVVQDPALKQQIIAAPDRPSLVSTAVKLGKEKGYNFTEQEVEDWLTNSANQSRPDGLSDEDLESIAGGKSSESVGSKAIETVYGIIPVVGGAVGAAACATADHPHHAQVSTSTTAAAVSCN
jgi:predicted ribosomally synthesized peptide with nif11-like leader